MVAMKILLPWQQDRLLISQLFRGIETPVLVWRYFLAKKQSFPKLAAWHGVSDQEMNCESFVLFDRICKQKIIDIPNNTKNLLNSIVSFSAKLIIYALT